MSILSHVRLMATYNQWMNRKVYQAAGSLSDEKLAEDRKAFFASILGTLNHLMIGDIIWLRRFSAHPAQHRTLNRLRDVELPQSLDEALYTVFSELSAEREALDDLIIQWCAELSQDDLQQTLYFKNMAGQQFAKPFAHVLLHLFNHQTHHRGQLTTMLSQEGLDVGVTDLLALIPDAVETQ
ncbi:MAG: DinB family protein [Congregibacter sp.]